MKYFLKIEFIFAVVILGVSIYLFTKSHRKWYPFQGLDGDTVKLLGNSHAIRVPKKKGRSTSMREEKTRDILEKIYGKKFPPIRPDFLKNPSTGKNLEIDCYNDELRLGIEVDGKQHAEYTPYFHENSGAFRYQVAKDDFKKKKCSIIGITLINIPHFVHTDDIERYLRLKLKKNHKLI